MKQPEPTWDVAMVEHPHKVLRRVRGLTADQLDALSLACRMIIATKTRWVYLSNEPRLLKE